MDYKIHSRDWRDFRLVYPVVARRSKGLSVGVNLNLDRICNFDCIYCEVNRRDFRQGKGPIPLPPKGQPHPTFSLEDLQTELTRLLQHVQTGGIWHEPEFADLPPQLKRLNDIAFSGDGEPTTYPQFAEAVQVAIEARRAAGLDENAVKLVLISNATQFHRPNVMAGLEQLMAHNGEIWAKLDAGTPDYYELIDKTAVRYERILANILLAAKKFSICIQTCMMRVHDQPPTEAEINAYCDRLQSVLDNGGHVKMVQLYTVARTPAQSYVTSLSDSDLQAIAATITARTALPVETFGGNVI